MVRYRWDKQRPAQIRQFLFRLLPLLLILILSSGFVWIFQNANLRSRLDQSVFEFASGRTVLAVKDYFGPLTELISSSVLWGNIGEINSIGDPAQYIELMQTRLKSIGTVSSFSMTDSEGKELVMSYPHDDSNWYVTDYDSDDSLTSLRKAAGIEYLSLEIGRTAEVPDELVESVFRISSVYPLPNLNFPGISLHLQSSIDSKSGGISLSMDLPLKQMSDRLKSDGAVKGSIIFILMPSGEDYIFLPVDDLLTLSDEIQVETVSEMQTPLDDNADQLISLLAEAAPDPHRDELQFRFESDGRIWLTEFLPMDVGTESLMIGTLVPVESLWTSQISLPLQIFLLAILAAAGFLVFRLLQDYREISRSPYRIEEMLRDELAGGETSTLEFKSSLRWDYHEEKVNKALEDIIVKSVAAFNNAQGGTLLIGVADDGAILGVEKDYSVLRQEGKDYFEIHLRNLIGSRYGAGYTSKNIAVDFPWLSGHEICRIRIHSGRQPLYTTVKSKSGSPVEKFFIRSGNTSQVLETPSEITNYILTRFSRWRIGKSLTES